MRDYSPKDFDKAQVVKFTIESEKWHPVAPGCLGFMANIKECSNPDRTRVGGMTLTADKARSLAFGVPGEEWPGWLIGPFDSFKFTAKNVTVSGVALLDPDANLDEIARLEGVTFEEIPR